MSVVFIRRVFPTLPVYQRLLVNGSSVVAAGMLFKDYHAPHANMIMFSSVCYPLAWVLMKNALRIGRFYR